MSIMPSDFDYVCRLVRERSGISLEPGKEYLVESRLSPLARREGFLNLQELIADLRRASNGLQYKVVEAMTTNETTFFRDVRPFEILRTVVLPQLISRRAGDRSLTVWSAACSSGQEPYSLAMLVREHFPSLLGSWRLQVIATDISREMLSRCRVGRFSQIEVNRGLPAQFLVKYFSKEGHEWQIKDELRRMVEFRELNLNDAWPGFPSVDIIFLRNVLIYFEVESKKAILAKMRRQLKPGGYLFLGGAETTLNLDDKFSALPGERTACYQVAG